MADDVTRIKPAANSIYQVPYGETDEARRYTINHKAFLAPGKYSKKDPTCRNCKETRGKIKLSKTGS